MLNLRGHRSIILIIQVLSSSGAGNSSTRVFIITIFLVSMFCLTVSPQSKCLWNFHCARILKKSKYEFR